MMKLIQAYKNKLRKRKSVKLYHEYYSSGKQTIMELLHYCKEKQKYNIAVWGAGLKGTAFLQTVDPEAKYITTVFDVDEKKVGTYTLTGHQITDYRKNDNKGIQVVLLMNNNYESEVAGLLKEAGMDVWLINIESVIDGMLTIDDILYKINEYSKPYLRRIQETIAAMVILYNCELDCIDNIKSYHSQVDLIFVYDNSTIKNEKLINHLKGMEKVVYFDGQGNQGIAVAINTIAREAIFRGFDWLITFDQDSYAEKDMIEIMCNYANRCEGLNRIGIICSAVKDPIFQFMTVSSEISYNKWVQQSGSMLNLRAFEEIEGFDENLFIDQVDFEYCVRLQLKDYKIVRVNKATLIHNTSDIDTVFMRKKGRPLYINKYSPMRYYYNTRNILYCINIYKKINKQYYEDQKRNLGSLLLTLPYEKKKISKVKAVILGYIDYKFRKMGKTNRYS